MNPISVKKPGVFFGWWIVVAMTVMSSFITGIVIFGFTAAFNPIAAEFSWSYAQVSFAASIRGLEGSILAPVVGFLYDRWGPRRWIFAGVLIIGLGLFLLSRTTSLATYYAAFVIISLGLSGCTGMITMAVIGNWFRKRIGLAIAIASNGGSLGGIFIPVVTRMIDVLDWRNAMMILGAGMLVICLPLTLVMRHKPEQYGYLPDGETESSQVATPHSASDVIPEVDIGIKQILKRRAFWHVALGTTLHIMAANTVIVYIMPYLTDLGIPRSTASLIAMALPLVSIPGGLAFGWSGDKFDKKYVAALAYASIAIGMLLFIFLSTTRFWLIIPFILFFSFGWRGFATLTPALQRDYYGRARLGAILGLTSGIGVIGSIIGPPLAGWIYDSYGNYQIAWIFLTGVAAFGTLVLLTAPPIISTREKIAQLQRS